MKSTCNKPIYLNTIVGMKIKLTINTLCSLEINHAGQCMGTTPYDDVLKANITGNMLNEATRQLGNLQRGNYPDLKDDSRTKLIQSFENIIAELKPYHPYI